MQMQQTRKVYTLSAVQKEVMLCVEALYYEAAQIENCAELNAAAGAKHANFRRRVADFLRNQVLQEAMTFHMDFN